MPTSADVKILNDRIMELALQILPHRRDTSARLTPNQFLQLFQECMWRGGYEKCAKRYNQIVKKINATPKDAAVIFANVEDDGKHFTINGKPAVYLGFWTHEYSTRMRLIAAGNISPAARKLTEAQLATPANKGTKKEKPNTQKSKQRRDNTKHRSKKRRSEAAHSSPEEILARHLAQLREELNIANVTEDELKDIYNQACIRTGELNDKFTVEVKRNRETRKAFKTYANKKRELLDRKRKNAKLIKTLEDLNQTPWVPPIETGEYDFDQAPVLERPATAHLTPQTLEDEPQHLNLKLLSSHEDEQIQHVLRKVFQQRSQNQKLLNSLERQGLINHVLGEAIEEFSAHANIIREDVANIDTDIRGIESANLTLQSQINAINEPA